MSAIDQILRFQETRARIQGDIDERRRALMQELQQATQDHHQIMDRVADLEGRLRAAEAIADTPIAQRLALELEATLAIHAQNAHEYRALLNRIEAERLELIVTQSRLDETLATLQS